MNLSQNTLDNHINNLFPFCRFSLLVSIISPYLPSNMRQPLFIFAKLYECMECLNPKNNLEFNSTIGTTKSAEEQWSDIFSKLSPFLSEQERARIEQMQNMVHMLKLYQSFQEIMPAMNQSPDALFSMLSPDQQEMFHTMQSAMQQSSTDIDSSTDTNSSDIEV